MSEQTTCLETFEEFTEAINQKRFGRWRLETDEEMPDPLFKLVVCSECGKTANDTYPYCPNCGFPMGPGVDHKAPEKDRLIETLKQYICMDPYQLRNEWETITEELTSLGLTLAPCYIGQRVWMPVLYLNSGIAKVVEGSVVMLQQDAGKSWKVQVFREDSVYDYTLDDFGKSIFLTEDAAEERLRKFVNEFGG